MIVSNFSLRISQKSILLGHTRLSATDCLPRIRISKRQSGICITQSRCIRTNGNKRNPWRGSAQGTSDLIISSRWVKWVSAAEGKYEVQKYFELNDKCKLFPPQSYPFLSPFIAINGDANWSLKKSRWVERFTSKGDMEGGPVRLTLSLTFTRYCWTTTLYSMTPLE